MKHRCRSRRGGLVGKEWGIPTCKHMSQCSLKSVSIVCVQKASGSQDSYHQLELHSCELALCVRLMALSLMYAGAWGAMPTLRLPCTACSHCHCWTTTAPTGMTLSLFPSDGVPMHLIGRRISCSASRTTHRPRGRASKRDASDVLQAFVIEAS